MDRNTLFAFGLIAVVLILTPWYMKVVAPDPKVVSLDSLSTPITDDLQNNKNTTKPFGPAPKVVNPKNLGFTAKTVITVENNLYSVEISNISGGSFVSFVLNNYIKHDSSFVNVIDALNVQNLVVSFVSLDGDLVSLDRA